MARPFFQKKYKYIKKLRKQSAFFLKTGILFQRIFVSLQSYIRRIAMQRSKTPGLTGFDSGQKRCVSMQSFVVPAL